MDLFVDVESANPLPIDGYERVLKAISLRKNGKVPLLAGWPLTVC